MTTCKVNGVPVRGAICGYIICNSDECGAPDDHKCIHMDRGDLREYTLITQRPDGTRGRVVLQARNSVEARQNAGDPVVLREASVPFKQCGGDCGDCVGCKK